MRKNLLICVSVLILAVLTGCGQSEAEAPETIVTEYDLEEAQAMIDEVEWLTAWLDTQESIERSAAENLIARINGATTFGEGANVLACALEDTAYWDDESMELLPLGNGTVAPTIYHEDVELVSAEVESRCVLDEETGECLEHSFETLRIRKEYTGDNPDFQGWFLEYVFHKPGEHGSDRGWDYVSGNGTYNLKGDLPLRSDFDPDKYPNP